MLLIAVTGASGVGKTTLVRALDDQKLPGVGCYYFDAVGVPEPEVMRAEFGSGEAWQAATTPRRAAWAAYLRGQADALDLPILDTSQQTLVEATRALVERVRGWVAA